MFSFKNVVGLSIKIKILGVTHCAQEKVCLNMEHNLVLLRNFLVCVLYKKKRKIRFIVCSAHLIEYITNADN